MDFDQQVDAHSRVTPHNGGAGGMIGSGRVRMLESGRRRMSLLMLASDRACRVACKFHFRFPRVRMWQGFDW